MTVIVGHDSAKTRKTLSAGGASVAYYSIPAAEAAGLGRFARLPASLKVVLENMLRFEDGKTVSLDDIRAFSEWADKGGKNPREIAAALAAGLLTRPTVLKAEPAGPGFVNLTLDASVWHGQIPAILRAGEGYGASATGRGCG